MDLIKDLAVKIVEAKDFEELKNVGKGLFALEESQDKSVLLASYKAKKRALVEQKKNEDSLFADLYWLIVSPASSSSRIGKILYKLKDTSLLSKGELSVLFEIYEKKKTREEEKKIDNNNDMEEDIIEVENEG